MLFMMCTWEDLTGINAMHVRKTENTNLRWRKNDANEKNEFSGEHAHSHTHVVYWIRV